MELHRRADELATLGTRAVAIAQEDRDLAEFARFQASGFEPRPRFELVADLGRTETEAWDRTSAYLLDEAGVVREVFPMLITHRASWDAVFDELRRR